MCKVSPKPWTVEDCDTQPKIFDAEGRWVATVGTRENAQHIADAANRTGSMSTSNLAGPQTQGAHNDI